MPLSRFFLKTIVVQFSLQCCVQMAIWLEAACSAATGAAHYTSTAARP